METNQNKINSENKSLTIKICLPTHAYFLSGIRDFTLNLIKNVTDFSEQWAFRFQSVVDELCNNAIEHGSEPGDLITITFTSIPHDRIEIEVEDEGKAKNHLKAEKKKKIIDERRAPNYIHKGIRGRGLSKIVSEWTDQLTFENTEKGGIKAKIIKHLNDPEFKKNLNNDPSHIVLT